MPSIANILAIAIRLLEVIAARTESKLDDTLLTLLRALAASPALIDWLERRFDALGGDGDAPGIPDGAMAAIAADKELVAAYEASPELVAWANAHADNAVRVAVPAGAEPLLGGAGNLLTLLKYLPILLQLLKAFRGLEK